MHGNKPDRLGDLFFSSMASLIGAVVLLALLFLALYLLKQILGLF